MIGPADVEHLLEQRHRDAMLDLVLAWASLDGALGMRLSKMLSIPLEQGAEMLRDVPSSARFAEMHKILVGTEGGASAARIIRKHKKTYERLSKLRNSIAHAHCAGSWKKDRDYVVFAVFRRFGPNELLLEAIRIQEMKRATVWGRAMTRVALQVYDGA